ncbi:4Fe-4S binding protein [Anaerotardibacter muris]|uniref:4Fe-4S binding protein n=1 Tax=Anaerotardibacter muris TaxID=2941505 RepID=UPI0020422B7D|nr:4Fe-4S binding protein [Anaerotardibacter muris]
MPSLFDAANAFSKLGKQSVEAYEAACVRVRDRHASCDLCLRVCSHEAITIENNELSIDHASCTGCGACTSACPTQALRSMDDIDAMAMAAIDRIQADAIGEDQTSRSSALEVTCEHARNVQATLHGEDAGTSEVLPPWSTDALGVPCLATLDESVLIHGACARVAIKAFSADCTQCPNANGALIEDIFAQAERLLLRFSEGLDEDCLLEYSWEVVKAVTADEAPALRDTSPEMTRRGMFDQLVARTTDSVAEAAVHTLYVTKANPEQKPTLTQTLKASPDTLKTVDVPRNASVLDDLYRLQSSQDMDAVLGPACAGNASFDQVIPSRLFGEAILDEKLCDLCGICMTFCPTQALSGIAREPVNPFVAATRGISITGELNFRANDCVNCRLCVDVCPHGALTIRSGIEREDLFTLEPRPLIVR